MKLRRIVKGGYLQAAVIFLFILYVWFFLKVSLTGIQVDIVGDIVAAGGLIVLAVMRISSVSRRYARKASKKKPTSAKFAIRRTELSNQRLDFQHELTTDMIEH